MSIVTEHTQLKAAPRNRAWRVAVTNQIEKDHGASLKKANILIVEDEVDIADMLQYNLEREGYDVKAVESGEQALKVVRSQLPDVVLLDLMLPGMGGLEVCRALKSDEATRGVTVIMVTAKGEESDIVAGLELGADDYITKPFSPRVLIARLGAVLRRASEAQQVEADPEASVKHNGVLIRPDRHEVTIDGALVDLTATEFRILHLLAKRAGRVFTRQQIIDAIHGTHTAVTTRAVDVQIVALRRKMGEQGKMVQTVRGVGYRFSEESGS